MAVWLFGRSSRATRSFNAIGLAHVLRFIDDRSDADLRLNRYLRTYLACDCSRHPGLEPRWRVRNQCHLPHRNGRSAASRLLLQLSIRDIDWRTDLRVACPSGIAESLFGQRRNPCLGVAHSILYWSAPCTNRTCHAAHTA